MAKRSREPLIWALFGAGGMMAALFLPAIALVLWILWPLGILEPMDRSALVALATHPLGRLFLSGLAVFSLFHWAHRFRYTLYDGLQLFHLNMLIAVLTYGIATALSVGSILVVWFLL